jgi:hypothetical protein
MVTDLMEKRFAGDEFTSAPQGMPVSPRFRLGYEAYLYRKVRRRRSVSVPGIRRDNDADFFRTRCRHLSDLKRKNGLTHSIPVDQSL